MMAEMVGFIAKIAMETSMDTKESQGMYVRYLINIWVRSGHSFKNN